MELKGDDSFPFCFRMIIGQVHCGNAINLMNLSVTNGGDCQFIPFAINEFLVLIPDLTNNFWLAIMAHNNLLKSFRNNPSPFLSVKHAVEFGFRVQIRLISFHHKFFGLAKQFAAILHASVIARKPNFQLQNKVTNVATLPDKKCVAVYRIIFCRLAEDCTVFHRPEPFFASPA